MTRQVKSLPGGEVVTEFGDLELLQGRSDQAFLPGVPATLRAFFA